LRSHDADEGSEHAIISRMSVSKDCLGYSNLLVKGTQKNEGVGTNQPFRFDTPLPGQAAAKEPPRLASHIKQLLLSEASTRSTQSLAFLAKCPTTFYRTGK
jgi:hypothetical protein